jgi:DNA repair protein RecO
MPIVKTTAVPLYWTDVSNTSRIVTWLSAHHGKLSTALKGDQRKNSPFQGQYSLFGTSELLFYDRTGRGGVHIAKECSLLNPRSGFRSDWRTCAAAGYIAALFAKTTPRHAHEPGRFELFEEMLTHAETFGRHPAFLIWFDLKFAGFQGQDLRLDEPGPPADPRSSHRFSAEHGGLIEPEYARINRIPAAPLPPEDLVLLKAWRQAPTPRSALAARIPPAHLARLHRILEKFVSWQFDLPPHVRRTAIEILQAA